MADQALHWPRGRGSARVGPPGRGREATVAVAGSVAFHALVPGYLALRGLSGAERPWPAPVDDPFPGGDRPIQVELLPSPPGEGRHVRLSRVVPHDRRRGMEQPAERSPDFHRPEPGRVPVPVVRPADREPEARPTDTVGSPPSVAPSGAVHGRPAPFSGPARTSTLACRTLGETLTFEEQAACDTRFGRAAARARVIAGTTDPARDARFAAEGQAELDAYEALRAPLRPRTPCEGTDMMGRCPFVIHIPLLSRKF